MFHNLFLNVFTGQLFKPSTEDLVSNTLANKYVKFLINTAIFDSLYYIDTNFRSLSIKELYFNRIFLDVIANLISMVIISSISITQDVVGQFTWTRVKDSFWTRGGLWQNLSKQRRQASKLDFLEFWYFKKSRKSFVAKLGDGKCGFLGVRAPRKAGETTSGWEEGPSPSWTLNLMSKPGLPVVKWPRDAKIRTRVRAPPYTVSTCSSRLSSD